MKWRPKTSAVDPTDKSLINGYAASGTSTYSRARAKNFTPENILRMEKADKASGKSRGRAGALLMSAEDMLADMKARLRFTSVAQRPNVERNIQRKTEFIAKLKKELAPCR